jgi:peptidoglycan/LPS O-acetylase OafA/YrhL
MRRFGARAQATILGTACLAVLVWRCVLVYHYHAPSDRTFKATDTRIDSILFGCILALFHNPVLDPVKVRKTPTKWLMILASGAVLVATFVYRAESFRQSFRYSCQGVALLALFYVAISNSRWPLFAWLDWTPLRVIGILSYSLYLIHFWAIHVVKYHRPSIGRIPLTVASAFISMTFAVIMYYAVERPCARLRRKLHA